MDRNGNSCTQAVPEKSSLSARRAWIEIHAFVVVALLAVVALRKESVDRNLNGRFGAIQHPKSLSARRAWIEIAKSTPEEAKRWSLSARRAWIEIA